MAGRIQRYVISAVLLFTGCAHVEHGPSTSEGTLIDGVPFVANRADDCGPASLAMVLSYWNHPVSVETIEKQIFSPSARGTLTVDMKWFAEQQNFEATTTHANTEILLQHLTDGHPVILLVDLGIFNLQKDHYLVAVGYTPDSLIVNSGTKRHERIPFSKLDRIWKRNNQWMLVVKPQNISREQL